MKVKFMIFNHNVTLIEEFENDLDIIPKIAEIVVLDEMDNTTEFIVTEILHYPKDKFIEIHCESFYRKNGYSRCFYLHQAGYLPPCNDLEE